MPKTNSKRRENKAAGGLKYIKLPRLGVVALQKLVGEAGRLRAPLFTWWGGVRRSGGGPRTLAYSHANARDTLQA